MEANALEVDKIRKRQISDEDLKVELLQRSIELNNGKISLPTELIQALDMKKNCDALINSLRNERRMIKCEKGYDEELDLMNALSMDTGS